MSDRNVQTVKHAYAAFQRGDMNAILSLLTDDVEWDGVKGTDGVLPQAGKRRGKPAVTEFCGQVAISTSFREFTDSAQLTRNRKRAFVTSIE
jgi:ketosteroid isomerase-like protein